MGGEPWVGLGWGDILELHAVEKEGGDVVVFEGEDGPVGAEWGC